MELAQLLERNQQTVQRRRLLRPTRLSKRTEVWYRDVLDAFIGQMQEIVLAALRQQPVNDAVQEDLSTAERIRLERLLDKITQTLQELAVQGFAVNMSAGMVARANQQNKSTIESSIKQALGIDIKGLLSESVVQQTLELAVRENVNLIKSIQTDYINQIGETIRNAIQRGRRHTDLIAEIRERGEVSQSRARMIARDQTAKINSDLTRERQMSLGITMYEWGGAGDERERTSHRLLNDKLCRYDDPAVYSDDGGVTWKSRRSLRAYDPASKKIVSAFIGHPGQDYQCRCFQLPFVKID